MTTRPRQLREVALHPDVVAVGTLLHVIGPTAVGAGPEYDRFPPNEMRAVAAFPRLGGRTASTDAICRICVARPDTTYDNFAGDFGERYLPGYRRPSVVDYLMNGPFEE